MQFDEYFLPALSLKVGRDILKLVVVMVQRPFMPKFPRHLSVSSFGFGRLFTLVMAV